MLIIILKILFCSFVDLYLRYEPSREKPNNAYAKTKAQISCAVTAQLISAFVFATWIVQFLFYLYSKFQASSLLLWLHRPVCVRSGPSGRNPNCWFSHAVDHIKYMKFCRKGFKLVILDEADAMTGDAQNSLRRGRY